MLALADSTTPISYYKRYKMEIGLRDLPVPELPPGALQWVAWCPDALELHAEALFASFHQEIDANVFPSLGNRQGCSHLMNEIARKFGFQPEATWLVMGPD